MDLQPEGDVRGHGMLAAWHDGCLCGWCESASRERGCLCKACVMLRSTSPYIELSDGLPTPLNKPTVRTAVR